MCLTKKIIVVFIALLLTACAVGPDYVKPKVIVPTRFKEAKNKKVVGGHPSKEWKMVSPSDTKDRGKWWKIFHDRELNKLEDQLDAYNQTLINAYANYQQARALVDEARASYFPSISALASLIRQKQSGGSTSFVSSTSSGSTSTGSATTSGGAAGAGSGRISVTHSLLLNATWEPDIWGLVRRTVEASAAGAQSSAALFAATRLSAQATLAQTYFELRGVDRDQQLLNQTVADYKVALRLTRYQYASGVASRADIVQAQSLLEAAQASAINVGIARAQYEHAIAVLIGVPPSNFSLHAYPHSHTVKTPAIPLSVPSTLLERRPDVAEAERLVAQANANIGVAIAAYFPSLSLSGSVSDVGRGASHWFSMPALGWSYGSQLTELVYDGGLRAATVAAARAAHRANVAAYRQVVLAAFQDVEDNLAALRILGEQSNALNQAAASAKLALKLVINQYKAGTVAYSSVVTAQINAYAAEKNAIDVHYLRMTAAVGLIKALGGGWNAAAICNAAD